jgi:Asp-tRNA(Asn)/Glu-tRNA(Gln) amidotransferase A subunit family amidase
LSAEEAAQAIRRGALSSEELVRACLSRIRELEPRVQAWAFLDEEHALAQARAADELKRSGAPIGPLHGVPVGVKDVFDTADLPTERGSALCAGRTPSRDAAAVALLRAAGAVILGKTVTTEFASAAPGKTRNPHDPERTPGGSSSGSAAAVAAGMVPLAIGSQTNGSVIRPAAFCGVVGFKPTHGLIPRAGMLLVSRTLDHVGVFARTIPDAALIAEQLFAYDERDPDTRPRARLPLREVAAEEPPIEPMLALVKTPRWETAEGEMKEAFLELAASLGSRVEEVELFPSAAEAWEWHQAIMDAETAANLEAEWNKGRDLLSAAVRAQIERGRQVSAAAYLRALSSVPRIRESLAELFEQRYDAILTPAAPGPAPRGLGSTGDPSFCTPWTLCGMPSISLPLLRTADGLPLGVQLVAPRDGDARLLRTARWLAAEVASSRK